MEYHSDRFEDHSLMIFDDEKLVGCFPAHQTGTALHSHLGLTYGAFLIKAPQRISSGETRLLSEKQESFYTHLVREVINYAKGKSFQKVELKLPPPFFDPEFDAHYQCLMEMGFEIYEESLDLVVDLHKEWKPSPKKTAGYRNGKFNQLRLIVCDDLQEFWNKLLIPQLQERHNAKPTHTLEEIQLLKSRFPTKILQYYAEFDGKKVAGLTLFDFDNILKVQYAAASQEGFEKNAMDFLYLEIIQEARGSGKQFVDLGTVNNADGTINEGLLRFKKQLGATAIPVFEIALDLRP